MNLFNHGLRVTNGARTLTLGIGDRVAAINKVIDQKADVGVLFPSHTKSGEYSKLGREIRQVLGRRSFAYFDESKAAYFKEMEVVRSGDRSKFSGLSDQAFREYHEWQYRKANPFIGSFAEERPLRNILG